MTLYKKILLWMLVIFFVLITAVFAVQFSTTRDYLQTQQSTELDNAIGAVGFALAPYLEHKDYVSAESVINATFDGSFYSNISLKMLDSDKTISRQYPLKIEGVPHWFTNLILLEPITRSTVLTSGWMQLAKLSVTSSPANSYLQLWNASVQLLFGFITTIIIGALALAAILKTVLTPLKEIQKQAQMISNNHFGEPLAIPSTRELSDVVQAFNHMSKQVKSYFEQQANEADKLRVRAFQDPVSGLANRSYLMTQLEAWLSRESSGGFALLKVDMIEDGYANQGYEKGDQLVLQLSKRLKELASDDFTIARLNQAEFALIAPNASDSELKVLGRSMLNMASSLNSDPLDLAPTQAAVGLVMRDHKDTISTLLAQADNAVNKAYQQADEPIVLIESHQHDLHIIGKQQWKQLVDEAIANKQIQFNYQKAIDQNRNVLHEEVFAYIEKAGKRISAGQFLSAIEQLNAGAKFDIYVLDALFEKVKQSNITEPVAVNITQSSINDNSFIRWISSKTESYSNLKNKIYFELPEICFVKNSNNVALLCEILHRNGFQFGIDNFGHNFGSLGYLNQFRPAYVKLDFAYTSQIDDEIKADVLASITRTAQNLNIMVIASRVETEAQKDKLSEFMISGFQGYITDKLNKES
ncbi:bifunctional diguanylate cyclase/phosphodiesterase [Photobacterium damselae]|uniref:HAMP domain-containing protein n=1 Tax=Photobacterium damselae TaxID=38293 RepID=A0ABD6X8G0_PHODM|nr:EAL domain-containing protein [Photobacterium damselae]EJN6961095.1 EAL domain-containing protein [Photobacterium damselae]MCG3846822.1 EAL domain-containing protein [Photobacterium damselae]MCG9780143.1 EAL domain-containing protein [Photobacterium damselae]OBU44814.1 diguanylate phosphodiesterase [Photobacterium damselae]PSU18432.1 HAMP domain-containing protein [Photobacterium damselae]